MLVVVQRNKLHDIARLVSSVLRRVKWLLVSIKLRHRTEIRIAHSNDDHR